MKHEDAEIFRGLEEGFINKLMYDASKEHLPGGRIIFKQGDPADTAFFLLKGQVKLSIGANQRLVYTIKNVGEFFGWSSLTGGDAYSTTAETIGTTRLLAINRDDLNEAMERYPASGLIIYERVAAILGSRLIRMHQALSETHGEFPLPKDKDQPLEYAADK